MHFDHMFVQSVCSPLRGPKKLSMAHIQNQVRPVYSRTKEQRGSRFLLSDCRNSLCEARLCAACLCPRINDREAEIFITRTESR